MEGYEDGDVPEMWHSEVRDTNLYLERSEPNATTGSEYLDQQQRIGAELMYLPQSSRTL